MRGSTRAYHSHHYKPFIFNPGKMDRPLALPLSGERSLCLTQPTIEEAKKIYGLSYQAWGDALTLPQYMERRMMAINDPLAQDSGTKEWILTDRTLPADDRPILSSCKTINKSAFVKQMDGSISETVVCGVFFVYCDPKYRRRGYTARLMMELAAMLPTWGGEWKRCSGSILFSSIGRQFYAKLGWQPSQINRHIELESTVGPWPGQVHRLRKQDLGSLCAQDAARVRRDMALSSSKKPQMVIVPDLDHMMRSIRNANFACKALFEKCPETNGAIISDGDCKVWAIWIHRYYAMPGQPDAKNLLMILRMVIHTADSSPDREKLQSTLVRSILQAAQVEATEWKLNAVKLRDPSPVVRKVLKHTSTQHRVVESNEDDIASLLWLGGGDGGDDPSEWLARELYTSA